MEAKEKEEKCLGKAELIDMIAEANEGLRKKDIKTVLDSLFRTIKETVAKGQAVTIVDFAKFSLEERKEREIYNPALKEKQLIPARKVIKIKASSTWLKKEEN